MKTQIVYLEPHDDLNSVRDKLSWTQASRVVLVWPGRGRLLTRRFDLVMLQRYAHNQGTQIGLVTLDPEVLQHAEYLQIPTFDSLEPQPEKAWRTKSRRQPLKAVPSGDEPSRQPPPRPTRRTPTTNQAVRIIAFSVGFLAMLLLAILLIPQAEIRIQPETIEVNETITIALDMEGTNGTTIPVGLPVRTIDTVIEGQLRTTTSGTTAQADQPARGEVTFTNLTSEGLVIPSGTSIRSVDAEAPYFLTQSRVTLEAEEGAQVAVEVIAARPGPDGNVPAGAIQAIDGPLGLLASVANASPMIGGSLEYRRAVSPADLSRMMLELEDDLYAEAHQTLLGMAWEGEDIIPGSIHITDTLEERFSNEAGEAADSLELILVLAFEGFVYAPDDLFDALERSLAQDLMPGEKIQPDTLEILNIPDLVLPPTGEEAEIYVTMSATVYEEFDRSAISTSVRAKPTDEAVNILNAQSSIKEVLSVFIRPSWIRRLPLLNLQIHVRYPWEPGV